MKLLRRYGRRGLSLGGRRRDIGRVQPKSDPCGRECGAETRNEVPMKDRHSPGNAALSLNQHEARQIYEQKYDRAKAYLGGGIAAERRIQNVHLVLLRNMPLPIAGQRMSYNGRNEFTVIQLTLD